MKRKINDEFPRGTILHLDYKLVIFFKVIADDGEGRINYHPTEWGANVLIVLIEF